jgi:hypothetical protein
MGKILSNIFVFVKSINEPFAIGVLVIPGDNITQFTIS